MNIELSKFTDAELARLIRAASAELAERLADEPPIKRVRATERAIELRVPPEDDKDFVLYIKSVVQKGGYVKSAERDRVAAIAKVYPEWVKRQQLPTDAGTGSWKKASEYMSVARPKER